MESFSLSDIKSCNRRDILKLYQELGLPIPGDADLEYLRGYLRLLKLKSEREAKLQSSHHSSQESFSEHYEDIDHGYENDFISKHEQLLVYSDPNEQTSARSLTAVDAESQTLDIKSPIPDLETLAMSNREKSPFYQPGVYTAKAGDDVRVFFNRFDRAAKINGWEDDKKTLYLPMYLEGAALSFFENMEVKKPNSKYDDYKQNFLTNFAPVESKELLMLELNSRVQQPTETVAEYTADIEKLCWLVDPNMSEPAICGHILKGLNPAMMQQISILDNTTIASLKSNISKYEQGSYLLRRRFGVAGQPEKSNTADIEAKINSLTDMVHEIHLSSRWNRDSRHRREQSSDYHSGRNSNQHYKDTHTDRRSRWDTSPRHSPIHDSRPSNFRGYSNLSPARPSSVLRESRMRSPYSTHRAQSPYRTISPNRPSYDSRDSRMRSPYSSYRAQSPYRAISPRRPTSPYSQDIRGRSNQRESQTYRQVRFSESPSHACRNCHKVGHSTAECRAHMYSKN